MSLSLEHAKFTHYQRNSNPTSSMTLEEFQPKQSVPPLTSHHYHTTYYGSLCLCWFYLCNHTMRSLRVKRQTYTIFSFIPVLLVLPALNINCFMHYMGCFPFSSNKLHATNVRNLPSAFLHYSHMHFSLTGGWYKYGFHFIVTPQYLALH